MEELEIAKATQNLRSINAGNLYRIDVYLDPEAGKIEVHRPVRDDESPDSTRPTKFFSSINVNRGGQGFPIAFEIKGATTLAEAAAGWPEAARETAAKAFDTLETAERVALLQSASNEPA